MILHPPTSRRRINPCKTSISRRYFAPLNVDYHPSAGGREGLAPAGCGLLLPSAYCLSLEQFGGLGGVQHQRTCHQAVKPSPDACCKVADMARKGSLKLRNAAESLSAVLVVFID